MCYSIARFYLKGWIEEFYIEPDFHFSYYGFEWIKPIGEFTYLIFVVCFISSLFVMIGLKYKTSIILFFLSFTYIELMDKTTYLNHYYFISILSFLLIFIPANATFSVDNIINQKKFTNIPRWSVDVLKLLITIVYLYAGIAKINSDWLIEAMPLKIWLQSKYDLLVKFDATRETDTDVIFIIPERSYQINVAQYFYEMVVLSIPLKRVHPGIKNGTLKNDILSKLKQLDPQNKKPAISKDPRWEKLESLL